MNILPQAPSLAGPNALLRKPPSGPAVAFGIVAVWLGLAALVGFCLPGLSQVLACLGFVTGCIGVLLGFRRPGVWVPMTGTAVAAVPLGLTVLFVIGLTSHDRGGNTGGGAARGRSAFAEPQMGPGQLAAGKIGREDIGTVPARPAPMPRSMSTPSQSGLDAEARQAALEHFARHWTHVGGSYVSLAQRQGFDGANDWGDDFYIEKKGADPVLQPVNVTEADRLNGVSWKGQVYFLERASREYFFRDRTSLLPLREERKGWTNWQAPGDLAFEGRGFWRLQLEKRAGRWDVKAVGFDDNAHLPLAGGDRNGTGKLNAGTFDPVEDYFSRKLAAAKDSLSHGKLAAAMKQAQIAQSLKPNDEGAITVLNDTQIAVLRDWRVADRSVLSQAIKGLVQRREKRGVPILREALRTKYDGKVHEGGGEPYTVFAWALAQLGDREAVPDIRRALTNTINAEASGGTLESVNSFLASLEALDGAAWHGFQVWSGGWTAFYRIQNATIEVKDAGGRLVPGKWVDDAARQKLTRVLQYLGPASVLGGSRTGLNISGYEPLVSVRGPDAVDLYVTIVSTSGGGEPKPVGGFTMALRATSEHSWVVADVKDPIIRGQAFVRFDGDDPKRSATGVVPPGKGPAATNPVIAMRPPATQPARRLPVWIGAAFAQDGSARVTTVIRGGPADAAGLKPGDEVHGLGSMRVSAHAELIDQVRSHVLGDTVEFRVVRRGQTLTVPVVLGAYTCGVRDWGEVFTASALRKAHRGILEVEQRHQIDLLVETFPSIPPAKQGQFREDQKERFFADWAAERAKSAQLSGVYLLVCKQPWRFQLLSGPQGLESFGPDDRTRLAAGLVKYFQQRDFDGALEYTVSFVRSVVEANPKPSKGNR